MQTLTTKPLPLNTKCQTPATQSQSGSKGKKKGDGESAKTSKIQPVPQDGEGSFQIDRVNLLRSSCFVKSSEFFSHDTSYSKLFSTTRHIIVQFITGTVELSINVGTHVFHFSYVRSCPTCTRQFLWHAENCCRIP